jgi:group I intron endonuclease
MNIYSIYKATNKINGKSYIGFDSDWPSRKYKHKQLSLKNKQSLYFAIRKYGWENFIWEVIYQSTDGKHCLSVMEPYFIKEYNCYINGYNMTIGGDGAIGYKHSEDMKKYLSEKRKGKGIPHTTETKYKMSLSKKGKLYSEEKKSKLGKKYIITDPAGYIFEIKNLNKFCRENNLDTSHMVSIAKGIRKTHKKYKCQYYE